MNQDVSEVFETFIYKTGLVQGDYSYSTAVGLFKSAVGLVMVSLVNRLAKNGAGGSVLNAAPERS